MLTYITTEHMHEHVRAYHCHEAIGGSNMETSFTATPSGMMRDLLALPGVVEVYLSRYRAQISKAPSWAWDEVEPAIVELLQCFDLRSVEKRQE